MLDDVLSHNFFANLYYDYRSDSKFTPYVGFGVGFRESRWITSITDGPECMIQRNQDIHYGITMAWILIFKAFRRKSVENLSGSEPKSCRYDHHRRAKLSDTLFGYQVLAGVDYQVSDPVTIGLKFRWADFGEFESDPREWDQLRSHESARRPGGARVQYKVMTDDIQFWGVSLNMKYQF